MASIMERNKKVKVPKKTLQDHAEDALYREVWEEVHAQKTYDFIKKYSKWLIAAALAILIVVVAWQLVRHNRMANLRNAANDYESAMIMVGAGRLDLASESFARVAKSASGGMSDLALLQSARADLMGGKYDAGIAKLEKLARDGDTRDYRDLAVIYLAVERGDNMTAAEFEKFTSALQTKRSPYYFTGLLLVAQKYIAVGDSINARVWLDKIITDRDAPATIVGIAETLK